MPFPELIEILPLRGPVRAQIAVPGSKSITNRALMLAALAQGDVTLAGALWSEDTQVMVQGLQRLGFEAQVAPDPAELCNRTIRVRGLAGSIGPGGSRAEPLELFVGNAGTAARFLAVMVCLGQGFYRVSGVPRMHERPQAALFQALRELGYRVEASNDKLPALIEGGGPRAGKCRVSITESSQFASAILLGARIGGWRVEVVGENAEESPYVAMTLKLIEVFPHAGGVFRIEPDCSSGSYFWAARQMAPAQPGGEASAIEVSHWPTSGWQIDESFPHFLKPSGTISRSKDLGDSIMTAMVLGALGTQAVEFTDLAQLRVQECDRVTALKTELARCGAMVLERGDTLTVFPSSSTLHGAEIETYNDHRMAMCFGILGLKVRGIKIKNPACVKKTFPNFFQKLAAGVPGGLGAALLDGAGGRLALEDLLAA